MKRQKRLTKRERKALNPGPKPPAPEHHHIHCVACGRHLDDEEFAAPASAMWVKCDHGSSYASCVACVSQAEALVAEHDRTNRPVQAKQAWH